MGNKPNQSSWKAFREKLKWWKPQDHMFIIQIFSHDSLDYSRIPIDPSDPVLRNDLDFYIPQFVNFIICESSDEADPRTGLLFYACRKSKHFAHRVTWFIESTSNPKFLKEMTELKRLVEIISRENAAPFLTPPGNSGRVSEIVSAYNERHFSFSAELPAVNLNELNLEPFPRRGIRDEYMSCLWFIEHLALIADKVLGSTMRQTVLMEEIKKLNLLLPANVYVPFRSLDEYCVLQIPYTETKVFETKDRAPCLISLEVFSPQQEMSNSSGEEDSKYDPSSLSLHTDSMRQDSSIPMEQLKSFAEKMENTPAILQINPSRDTVAPIYNHDRNQKRESFQKQSARVRNYSPFGNFRTWRFIKLIIKAGDDLLQEQLAMQLIYKFNQIFHEAKLDIWLRPYEIISISSRCGLVECINDAYSIDSIKKSLPGHLHSLGDYFRMKFGPADSRRFKQARDNFTRSLAGYSLLCYALQIKDRHNGNILLDSEGHIIHIDFGFILSLAPGGSFENAPFKLTTEFLEIMGGGNSSAFRVFRKLCVKGFLLIRKHQDELLFMIEAMKNGVGENLRCYGERSEEEFRARMCPDMSYKRCKRHIHNLINQSIDNWRTNWYDRYQFCCQNIFY